jgi:hypothetical protein
MFCHEKSYKKIIVENFCEYKPRKAQMSQIETNVLKCLFVLNFFSKELKQRISFKFLNEIKWNNKMGRGWGAGRKKENGREQSICLNQNFNIKLDRF